MGRFNVLVSIFFSVMLFVGCAHPTKPIARDIASLNASGGISGVWFLQGTSSTRGPYNGELELRPSHDGTYDVIRVVTYINYFFDGLRVQEVWQGKAVADTDTLTVSYDLKQGDFITRLDSYTKTIDEMKTPLTISMRFFPSPTGLTAKFSDKRVSEYSEWLTTKRSLDPNPLWKNETVQESAAGKPIPANERQLIRNAQKILNYARDPLIQESKNKPDFKAEKPSVVIDRTDFTFYQGNKEVIRLVNKVTDDATIAEGVLKRNAYFPSLNDKVTRIDDNTVARNFSYLDLIVVRKDQGGTLNVFNEDVDAAFTTGMYIASQSMRYQVKRDNQALLNIKRAMNGVRNLIEVSKGDYALASTVAPLAKELENNWLQGAGSYKDYMWIRGDQSQALLGIIHGLTMVSISIPRSEVDIWNVLQNAVQELNKKDLNTVSASTRGSLKGLTALVLQDARAAQEFSADHPPKKGFYWAGNADWSKEFQSTIESINHIHLANALHNDSVSREWKKYLLDEWIIYSPAQRPLKTFAAFGFFSGSSEMSATLAGAIPEAVRSLREMPYPRTRMDVTIDHSVRPTWVASPIPRNYWDVKDKNRKSILTYYQGLQQLPLFSLQAVTSRFVWKEDAFQYRGRGSKDIEATGVDYLYGYWLARFSGIPDLKDFNL